VTLSAFSSGAALLLVLLLMSAGSMKLLRPSGFVRAVHRLLPARLRFAAHIAKLSAPVVSTCEVGLATLLLVARWWETSWLPEVSLAVAVVCSGFVLVVAIAVRKGTSCGCFSSFSDQVAAGGELGRSLALAAIAWALFVVAAGATAQSVYGWRWVDPVWFVLLAMVMVAADILGGRFMPQTKQALDAPDRRTRIRRCIAHSLGRVSSNLAPVPMPVPVLRRGERARVIAHLSISPTMALFESWLGERASEIDWQSASVDRMTSVSTAGRSSGDMITPPRTEWARLTATMFMRDGMCESVITGRVDGSWIVTTKERVSCGSEVLARPTAATAPSSAGNGGRPLKP
jgi:hypothetical protein